MIDTLGMGGAETWLMELLRRWSVGDLVASDVLSTSGRPGVFDDEARALGARIFYAQFSRRGLPRFAREFRAILKSGRYDAIHDHQDYASGWHFLVGSGRLPPVRVTHVHNPSYQILSNYGVTLSRRAASRIGRRLVSRLATHVAGTSNEALREYGFRDAMFAHLSVGALYCGFDPRRFLLDRDDARRRLLAEFGWAADSRISLLVGRIDQSPEATDAQTHKNSGFAVDVAISAARKCPRQKMLLAGAWSPAVPVLAQRIREAGLEGQIVYAGLRRDVPVLMTGADLLLFPSRAEGLGMVAVEAQAAGSPVLASSTVPRECVVVPELVAFLDLSAGREAWAEKVIEMSARSFDRRAANQRVMASPFSIERSASALLELYGGGSRP